ncbi:MAG: right-handed parallel beta-helix repeat-containing protein [Phycisphaerae bacterium]|nr:right-handed parallel beta-helix repeat-containing protein [Phycisphaerae bacterium]
MAADHPEDWQPAGEHLWDTKPLRFEPVGNQTDLPQQRWSLHHEGGASCDLARDKQDADGKTTLRLTCRKPGTRSNHLQLFISGLAVQEGEYYLVSFQAQATKPFTPASVALMKQDSPWTSYASPETDPPTIGTTWAEYTIRFRVTTTAADARITVFLGGALPADSTLLVKPGRLTQARCNQSMPLSVDVGNIIFDHGKTTGVKKWKLDDLRRDGDYLYDARSWQVKLRSDANPATRYRSIELALRRHIVDQSGRGHVSYENLDLRYGAAHGFGGGGVHHITIRGCEISYIGGGHQLTRPDGSPVRFGNGIEFWADARGCLVEDCRIWEIYDAALTNQGSGKNVQENITYRRNVIWNSEYSFEYWNREAASRTNNIVFEHNTCVDAGFGWGHGQRPDPNGRHLMFYDNTAATTKVMIRHNIFCNATDSLMRLHGRDWTAELAMDFNCWIQARGPWVLWDKQNVGAEGFSAFMRSHGLDGHSVLADPKFVDAAKRDYHLTPDSPARGLAGQGKAAGALP